MLTDLVKHGYMHKTGNFHPIQRQLWSNNFGSFSIEHSNLKPVIILYVADAYLLSS